jgi:hypothetical protein
MIHSKVINNMFAYFTSQKILIPAQNGNLKGTKTKYINLPIK